MTWYFVCLPDGEVCNRFNNLSDLTDFIRDYDVTGADFYRAEDGKWTQINGLVDDCLEEARLEAHYDENHIEWVSSPEKTGRV
jgi:hypothetical protein